MIWVIPNALERCEALVDGSSGELPALRPLMLQAGRSCLALP